MFKINQGFNWTHSEAGCEDTIAQLHGTANLRRTLPDDLGKVGGLGVVRIVFGCILISL